MRLSFFLLALSLRLTVAHAATLTGTVTDVSGGDTFTLQTQAKRNVTVRLHGITAPESDQPFGPRARQELSNLVIGKVVTVQVQAKTRDGRTIGRVFIDKLSVNTEIVRRGFAWWYRDEAKKERELETAELDARSAGRGLWGGSVATPPSDRVEAVKWYRNAADLGDAEAQYILGVKYFSGEGVPKDKVEAAKWIRRAAVIGLANAQAFFGSLCRSGDGVPKDAAEAVKWFQKAADQNQPHAQASLGQMYSTGEGVPKGLVLAYVWCSLAGDRGEGSGRKYLATIEPQMTPEQKAEAKKMVLEFSEKWKSP
jgi:TPR repeat protein